MRYLGVFLVALVVLTGCGASDQEAGVDTNDGASVGEVQPSESTSDGKAPESSAPEAGTPSSGSGSGGDGEAESRDPAPGDAPAPAKDPDTDSGADDRHGSGTAVDQPDAVPGTVVATAEPRTGAISYIADVRSAAHGGHDRVVFEFENSVPGYELAYVQAPVHVDPSGRETTVDGATLLQVRMFPASAVDLSVVGTEAYRETYTGPDRVRSDTRNVTEVVEGTDFEADTTWVIGMRRPGQVSVSALEDPARLVVDVTS